VAVLVEIYPQMLRLEVPTQEAVVAGAEMVLILLAVQAL
jgi:hypothetical protein